MLETESDYQKKTEAEHQCIGRNLPHGATPFKKHVREIIKEPILLCNIFKLMSIYLIKKERTDTPVRSGKILTRVYLKIHAERKSENFEMKIMRDSEGIDSISKN